MRRFFLGCALIVLCALPFRLKSVDAGASTAGAPSEVRTVARGIAAGGLTADAAGRVYFSANDRIYRVSSGLRLAVDGQTATNDENEVVAGNGERGSLGDGGPAILAQLDLFATDSSVRNGANGDLAADISGNLFLADTLNDTIRRIDAESQLISSIAGRWATGNLASATSERISRPLLIAVDALGNTYIAGSNELLRLESSGALSQIATVVDPVALAVSREGDSIAVSIAAGRMLVLFERSNTRRYQIASTWSATRGTDFAATARTNRTADRIDNPAGQASSSATYSGLAFDASGKIFAADGHANIVERFDINASTHEIIAGNGRSGYSGDGGPPSAAEFNGPGALAIDRDGNLFVADTGNLAIREITRAAAAAGVTLTPNTFTFPNQPTGGSSAPEIFTLTNNSSVEVTGITIDFTGGATPPDFTQTSACATTLDAGSSCTISVMFSPQAAGNRSAALHVADSDPSSPQTASLSGFADDYELALQSGNTDTLTIVQGGTANYNLAVVPDNIFSGTVTIQCPVGLPLDVACGLAAGTASSSSGGASGASGPTTLALTVTPGMSQNFTLALTTMAKNQTRLAPQFRRWPNVPSSGLGIAIFLAVAAVLALWRALRRTNQYRARLVAIPSVGLGHHGLILMTAILMFAVSGCGSSGTPTLTTKPNPGTPAGTYHFNVIGSSQGASRAFTITLIVQTP
jgi:hypothetical protein